MATLDRSQQSSLEGNSRATIRESVPVQNGTHPTPGALSPYPTTDEDRIIDIKIAQPDLVRACARPSLTAYSACIIETPCTDARATYLAR